MSQPPQRVHSTPANTTDPVKPYQVIWIDTSQPDYRNVTVDQINTFSKRLLGELFGTFILTWAHAGLSLSLANTAAELPDSPNNNANISAYGFGSGLTVAGLVYALGHISGAHLNPSISTAFLVRGEMKLVTWCSYVIVQVAGGFAAAGILDAVFINDAAHGYLGANHPAGGFTILSAFWMEFIASVFFQICVLNTATRGKNMEGHAALAAGLSIGALITYLAPYGGGSMNPARSIGPGVLASSPDIQGVTWIYVVAPLGAGICTGLVSRWFTPKKPLKEKDDDNIPALAEQRVPLSGTSDRPNIIPEA